jgi:hypothetical protein
MKIQYSRGYVQDLLTAGARLAGRRRCAVAAGLILLCVASAPARAAEPAATLLGKPSFSTPAEIEIMLSAQEIAKIPACPPGQKKEDMEACARKRMAAAKKKVRPADGKAFVAATFSGARKSTPIQYVSTEWKLQLADGTSIKPHAFRTQGNKFEAGGKRVPWPEMHNLQLDIYMTTYLPMDGESAFTVVFEVPKTARQGTLLIGEAKTQAKW